MKRRKLPPLRTIRSRALRLSRGHGWYTHETLECGHDYKTDATGAAISRAKRRRCVKCMESDR